MTRDRERSAADRRVEREIRAYYRTVARFIDRERPERSDLALWEQLAGEHAGGDALDLGCGTGRVTAILADRMDRVAGIDLSVPMLARARRRTRSGGGAPALVAADMRRVNFARRFDLVTAANDPFAHLAGDEDRDRALAAVASQLAPHGQFVLDAHWFPPDLRERALAAEGLSTEHAGAGMTVRERWWCTADGRCRARYEYHRNGELVEAAEFVARYWTLEEARRRFEGAGLEIGALWGDYERTPWDARSSRNLIVAAGPARGSR